MTVLLPRHLARLSSLGMLLAACGGTTDPDLGQPGLRVVLGAGVTDTIDARPPQALVVEVRRSDGTIARDATVRFEPQPPEDPARRSDVAIQVCRLDATVCGSGSPGLSTSAIDTTDADGRAKVLVRFGRVAGRAVVGVVVPELGMVQSAEFTVTPGAAARVRAVPADTSVDIGGSATVRGRVVDRYDNPRAEVPALSAGSGDAMSLDASTGVVTARQMGMQWVFMRHGTFVDSGSVRVLPPGRLVVWSSAARALRLVNLNGSETRTLVSNVSSDLGAFPHFDPSRQRVTLCTAASGVGGIPSTVVVVDTTGAPRRDIAGPAAFSTVLAVRQLAGGDVLVVGRRHVDPSSSRFALWRVAADDALTQLATLPDLASTYGGVDISPDGARVALLASSGPFLSELRVLDAATGATTAIEPSARAPRWSPQGDRLAYLAPASSFSGVDGTAVVINADGTGRRPLGGTVFSPGLAWSPDGAYLVGRKGTAAFGESSALRLLRVSDGVEVPLRFRGATGSDEDYYQPDWR